MLWPASSAEGSPNQTLARVVTQFDNPKTMTSQWIATVMPNRAIEIHDSVHSPRVNT
jgi:hypothetical protein